MSKNVQNKTNVTNLKGVNDTMAKVNYVGVTHEAIENGPARYRNLMPVLNYFEDKLDEPLNFNVNLDYITLHALFIAMCADEDSDIILIEESIEHFEVMDAVNFFKLINDISVQAKYYEAYEIYYHFLSHQNTLKRLNDFYNEYTDIFNACINHKYSSLYVYELLRDSKNENYKPNNSLTNFIKYINDKDNKKRHFACILLNEFLNEMNQFDPSERTRDEYWYQMYSINKKLDDILSSKDIDITKNYCISTVYDKFIA